MKKAPLKVPQWWHHARSFNVWSCCLTFLCSLLEAVIDLLKHGLAASLKNRQHNALEGIFICCLDGTLHCFSCCSTNRICCVLDVETEDLCKQVKDSKVLTHKIKKNLNRWRSEPATTLDLTTLVTLSFRVTSTAVSLAAIVLFSWHVTGSRLLEIAKERERGRNQQELCYNSACEQDSRKSTEMSHPHIRGQERWGKKTPLSA